MTLRLALLLAAAPIAIAAQAAPAPPRPPAQVLEGTVAQTGLLPVNVDRRQGRIIVSLPAPDADGISGRFVYVASLETGLGSAPIGLDRGLAGGSRIIVFRRVGRKLVAEIRLFDVYEGAGLPEGKKSLAITVVLQPQERTLTDSEIEGFSKRLIAQVEKATGGKLRG